MLLLLAVAVPILALQVKGETNAGEDQTVYVDNTVIFNATTSEDLNTIGNVTWNFGDGSAIVNSTSPSLLNTTHTYTTTGKYNVTLSVEYDTKNETDLVIVTVVDNVPPVADAGPDQTVEQTSPAGAEVTLNGSASADQYGDPLTYNWNWSGGSSSGVSPTVMLPPGTTEVTLTVNDGVFNSTDALNVTIEDTTAPLVDAGENATIEATSPAGAEVTLYGNATDAVDMDLDFVWSEGATVLGTEENLTITLSLGTHTLTLNATDDSGNTGTDTVVIDIVDTTPPNVDAGEDMTVEATSPAGAEVMLQGNATDIVDMNLDLMWKEGATVLGTEANLTYTFSLGTHTLTLNATDDSGNTATDDVTVEVVDTTAPDVDAGDDMTVEATSPAGAEVMLYGNATDAVDMDLDFVWSEGATVLGTEENLTITLSLGTHTLTLNATDDSGNTGTDTVVIDIVDTTPPNVDAGEDMTVEATSPAGAEVMLQGNATDIVDMNLDLMWKEGATVLGTEANLTYTFSLGTHILTLSATDDSGNTASDNVTVNIVDTTAPVVDAGADTTVEAGFETTIHGSATDAVDLNLDYVWTEGATVLGTEADLTYTFSLGTHILTLSATDDSGNTGTDSVTIEAVDTTPPDINVTVVPDIMWPPNHKYANVETVVTVHDVVDPSPTVTLVSVTSNEPENGKGDGNTTDDIVIVDLTTFMLRAERSGLGEGRTYTITYRATDASGNSAEASVTITVPHNQ